MIGLCILVSIIGGASGFNVWVPSSTRTPSANDVLRAAFRVSTPRAHWISRSAATPDEEQKRAFAEVADATLVIPEYFKAPFHAYDQGNLNWESALDAEAAGVAVLKGAEGVREEFAELALKYAATHRREFPRSTRANILDVGCGVGISTKEATKLAALGTRRGGAVVGVDLSPHMLAVAATSKREEPDVAFVHAAAEQLPFKEGTFDAVQICFVLHEVPAVVASRILKEAHRVLKRGGVLGVLDFNGAPKASNPAMQFIFDRTEPFWSEYKVTSDLMPELLAVAGFANAHKHTFSRKHAAWFGLRAQPATVPTPYGTWTSVPAARNSAVMQVAKV